MEISMSCPECGGSPTPNGGEVICEECGLIIREDNIDRGAEWHTYNAEEKERVGSPLTEKLHDRGLTTTIGNNVDGNGNSLKQKKKRQMNRLRRLQNQTTQERQVKRGFTELSRVCSSLGIPDQTRERICSLYRQAQDQGVVKGRTIEGVAGACVYIVCKIENIPRTKEKIASVSRGVDGFEILSATRKMERILGLAIEPTDPREYLTKFINKLEKNHGLPDDLHHVLQEAIEILSEVDEKEMSGKSPSGLAASSIYLASLEVGEEITQRKISDAANVSKMTIRNRYKELAKVYDD